jgi:hypothetical protein
MDYKQKQDRGRSQKIREIREIRVPLINSVPLYI